MSMSYQELMARRDKRKQDEISFATRRPKIPKGSPAALTIMILQWCIDELYAEWRSKELEKAQAIKEVIKPKRSRGGRRNSVLEQLGLA